MWTHTFRKTYKNVKKEAVWNLWTDIPNWPKWHGDLEYCKMEGPFEVGNFFFLKPKNMKPVKISLTEINWGQSFTDCTEFFGAKMYDTHTLKETSQGLEMENTLLVTGPLTWLWVKLVAQHVANTGEEEMEMLINLARDCHV